MSLFIIKLLKYNNIIIGVPSISLLKQWKEQIKRLFDYKILSIGSDINDTTDTIEISNFINNIRKRFIITTYSSCHLLKSYKFDFKIGDEAHRLVGIDEGEKTYKKFHEIQSNKILFMTATEKMCDDKKLKSDTSISNLYSMDCEYEFGGLIGDEKSVNWAIENNKISDYWLLILKNTEEDISNIIEKIGNIRKINKELFMAAYMTLKSIKKYDDLSHILIYANTTNHADLIDEYISKILKLPLFKELDVYHESIHSKNNQDVQYEISKFKQAKIGIISSVYIFGEGVDIPKLNGVTFAENMNSKIRIVQSALRPNRLDKHNPNKKAYLIIPFNDVPDASGVSDWLVENKSFKKLRKIVDKLRNVDKNIEQRMILSKRDFNSTQSNSSFINEQCDIDDDKNELESIKLRLRHSKALNSNLSEEEEEYNLVRCENIKLKIQEISDYLHRLDKKSHPYYVENPKEYFNRKGVWKNWYHFLGIDDKFIKTKDEWVKKCVKLDIKDVNDYKKASKKIPELPERPGEFYIHFSSIEGELPQNNDWRF